MNSSPFGEARFSPNKSPYHEQRAYPRYDCNILVSFESGHQSGIGVITDVSQHGVGLTCRCAGEIRGSIRVKPYRLQRSGAESACYGQVMWNKKAADTGQLHLGVELQLDRDWLRQVLRSDTRAPAWDRPEQRLDLVMGY